MDLFRIAQDKFAEDLSGNGARLFGGRWNSEGYFAVYTSTTRALALLETLAHTPAKMFDTKVYQLITLTVPDNLFIEEIVLSQIPEGWDAPDARGITKKLGDAFFKSKKGLLLSVPSVLVKEELNYVFNPLHPDMRKVKISNKRRVDFDKRVGANL